MQTCRSAREIITSGRRASLAIGTFDGVHLGHQQVIRQAVADAEQHEGMAIAVTFDRHPGSIVAPDRVPPAIYHETQKLRALASLGLDATLIIPFTREFSNQTGEQFIRSLAADLGSLASVSVGSNFVFGHRRSGDVPLLQQLGRELGFAVHGLSAVAVDGEPVSSTRIREAIREGRLAQAAELLGREYALSGIIARGDALGRKLGYPTANLDVAGRIVPPGGVYAVHAYLGGQRFRGAANIGFRPTLNHPSPQLRVETHLLDFNGEIYGQEMSLTFVTRLRGEMKFGSLEELQAQIGRDVTAARQSF